MTSTFDPRRATVMTQTRTKAQVRKSVGSNDIVGTDRQTNERYRYLPGQYRPRLQAAVQLLRCCYRGTNSIHTLQSSLHNHNRPSSSTFCQAYTPELTRTCRTLSNVKLTTISGCTREQ